MLKGTLIPLILIFSTNLLAQLSGTYLVGASPSDFNDLTEVRDSINAVGVSAPIRLKLKPGNHGDTLHWYYVKTHPITIESQNGDTATTSIVVTQFGNCDFISFKNLTIIPLAGGPYRFTDQGAHFDRCKGIIIDSCLIKGKNKKDYKIGITITDSYGFTVSNSHFVNLEMGIVYSEYSNSASGRHRGINLISQNKFHTSEKSIKLYGEFYDTTIVQGNIIEGGKNGISIVTNGNITSFNLFGQLLIDANHIYSTIEEALKINTTYNGNGVISVTNNMFSGGPEWNNYFHNGSTSFVIKSQNTVSIFGLSDIRFLNNSIYGGLHYGNFGINAKLMNNAIYCPQPLALVYGSNPANNFFNNSFYTPYTADTLGFNQGFTSTIFSFNGWISGNNIWANPHFTSSIDLHACSDSLKAAGQYSGIPFDFDFEPRDLAAPDIGADEYKSSPQPPCAFANFHCTDSALSFRFTDDSPRSKTSNWTFSDGTSYASADFIKKFDSAGVYQFTLITSNSYGADSLTQSIDLSKIKQENISVTGNTLSINRGYQGYQWYLDSVAIPSANSHSYLAKTPGFYKVKYKNDLDCWVWAINSPFLSDSEYDFQGDVFSLYPNPANHAINIKSPEKRIDRIEIYSAAGRLMKEEVVGSYEASINAQDLAPGLYFIKLYGEKLSASGKFQVVH